MSCGRYVECPAYSCSKASDSAYRVTKVRKKTVVGVEEHSHLDIPNPTTSFCMLPARGYGNTSALTVSCLFRATAGLRKTCQRIRQETSRRLRPPHIATKLCPRILRTVEPSDVLSSDVIAVEPRAAACQIDRKMCSDAVRVMPLLSITVHPRIPAVQKYSCA